MSTPDLKFFIEPSVEKEFFACQAASAIKPFSESLTSTAKSFFNDPAMAWNDDASYRVAVLPVSWLTSLLETPESAKLKILNGTCRIVFWNVTEASAASWPLPATLIPAGATAVAKEFLVTHLGRCPGWGLTGTMPAKTKIFTQRLASESQIASKIEKSIDFVQMFRPELENQTLGLRSAMTGCFAAALSDISTAPGSKPATFQIGFSETAFAFSLRWKEASCAIEKWRSPGIHWQSVLSFSSTALIQINSETSETELQLLFVPGERSNPMLFGLQSTDVLSKFRLAAARSLPSAAETFDFEYFQIKAESPKTEFESRPPEQKENPQLEITGLRVERQKLDKQLKSLQAQMGESIRKMAQAIEAEKNAQTQIKSLTSRLEISKDKETELNKKLSQALEVVQKLKTTKAVA